MIINHGNILYQLLLNIKKAISSCCVTKKLAVTLVSALL